MHTSYCLVHKVNSTTSINISMLLLFSLALICFFPHVYYYDSLEAALVNRPTWYGQHMRQIQEVVVCGHFLCPDSIFLIVEWFCLQLCGRKERTFSLVLYWNKLLNKCILFRSSTSTENGQVHGIIQKLRPKRSLHILTAELLKAWKRVPVQKMFF